jgi:hypothetical protein
MEYIVTALWVAVFTVALILLYKYLINPQIIVTADTSSMAKCPDRWNYDSIKKMCEPGYETHCLPFNPDVPTLNTYSAKCNVARSCGTTWSGFCG